MCRSAPANRPLFSPTTGSCADDPGESERVTSPATLRIRLGRGRPGEDGNHRPGTASCASGKREKSMPCATSPGRLLLIWSETRQRVRKEGVKPEGAAASMCRFSQWGPTPHSPPSPRVHARLQSADDLRERSDTLGGMLLEHGPTRPTPPLVPGKRVDNRSLFHARSTRDVSIPNSSTGSPQLIPNRKP